ncbi:MAG: hypothetical protein ABIJ96_00180 [Elusimicrobiota bacterium]
MPLPANKDVVVIALDTAADKREYFLCSGSDLGGGDGFKKVRPGTLFAPENDAFFASLADGGRVHIIVYPTRTYSEGFGGSMFSDIAPEDRRMIRKIRARYEDRTDCCKVPLSDTLLFEGLEKYFAGDEERARYRSEKSAPVEKKQERIKREGKRGFFTVDPKYLINIKEIFVSCMTRPNRQDYMWLATKTFGLNLVVRLFFVCKGVMSGDLSMVRAVLSTTWYQIQDAVFTVFGQTYMKFLGKMTGLIRIRNAQVGDFVFVYFQLCGFEFLNRLLLGPLGENPLVYTGFGIGLIFVNILQGMLSGGPLIPAINKMRRAGVISHPVMMHLYQASSLTMQFGLLASFGYQTFYAILTGAVLVFSWSSYVIFSTFFKDPEFSGVTDRELMAKLDGLAAKCYASS